MKIKSISKNDNHYTEDDNDDYNNDNNDDHGVAILKNVNPGLGLNLIEILWAHCHLLE